MDTRDEIYVGKNCVGCLYILYNKWTFNTSNLMLNNVFTFNFSEKYIYGSTVY